MSTLSATNLKNASSGSNNIVLATDGSTTITTLNGTTITGTSVRGVVTSGTAVASTSGTSIDFTSIPSWVKRVTVMFSGVSTNGTSNLQIQLGISSGIDSASYTSGADNSGGSGITTSTSGFILTQQIAAANLAYGTAVISLLGSNGWVYSSSLYSTLPRIHMGGGTKTLSGTLDRVRITTVNGTDTFDAGSINILYEG